MKTMKQLQKRLLDDYDNYCDLYTAEANSRNDYDKLHDYMIKQAMISYYYLWAFNRDVREDYETYINNGFNLKALKD